MELFITLIVIVIVVTAFVSGSNSKSKKLEALKLDYERSLKGTNKKTALDAGRAYYSALREKQVLTIYDEQAITNDLSTMNDQPAVYQQ